MNRDQIALLNSLAQNPLFAGVLDAVPLPEEYREVYEDEGVRMVRLTPEGHRAARKANG